MPCGDSVTTHGPMVASAFAVTPSNLVSAETPSAAPSHGNGRASQRASQRGPQLRSESLSRHVPRSQAA
eukprot:scaffold132601_cov75-Phaeocystis_antarctica.AAC.3